MSGRPSWKIRPWSNGNSSGWMKMAARTSVRSLPRCLAIASMVRSIAYTPCGRPAPR